jgi:putative DNA primase/helicase
VTLSLHPEALEDLRKSGLSDTTIAAAGLYTPAPGDLPRLLSARLVDQVRHVLVFPYDGASPGIPVRRAGEFVRCKLFPPVSDGHGHTIRYYQRAGTPPRLYVPALARSALADPAVPLLVTEGEKKALKASQEGLASVAVGGLWNWQANGRAIADLGRIDWVERETVIVPDSDAWTRPDLVCACGSSGVAPAACLCLRLQRRGSSGVPGQRLSVGIMSQCRGSGTRRRQPRRVARVGYPHPPEAGVPGRRPPGR